jgi:hypothetical protein
VVPVSYYKQAYYKQAYYKLTYNNADRTALNPMASTNNLIPSPVITPAVLAREMAASNVEISMVDTSTVPERDETRERWDERDEMR